MARIRKNQSLPNGVGNSVLDIPEIDNIPNFGDVLSQPSRMPNDGGLSGAGRNPGGSRSEDESSVAGSSIARKIINSPTYQNALKIFTAESDKQWLQRLELIPFSVTDANSTIFDEWNISNGYADKTFASYQFAMEQITNLVSEYYQYKNTLPVNQVQQFADAGINSAITGQGIDGSSINPQSASTNPSSISSTNAGDILSVASNFILDATTGLSSVVKNFRELRMAESQQLFEFHKYLREQGMSFKSDKSYKSLGALIRGINKGDAYILSDPKGDQIRFENILTSLMTQERFAPIMKRFYDVEGSDGLPKYKEFAGQFGIDFDNTYPGMLGVQAVSDAQYKKFVLDFERQLLQNKYTLSLSDESLETTDLEQASKKYKNDLFNLELDKAKIYFELINNLHSSEDPADHYLLSKILTNYNPDDISILSSQASFADTERAMGVLGQILRLLSPR